MNEIEQEQERITMLMVWNGGGKLIKASPGHFIERDGEIFIKFRSFPIELPARRNAALSNDVLTVLDVREGKIIVTTNDLNASLKGELH